MKRSSFFAVFSLLIVAAMVLAACGKATPTATTAPVVATTAAPTAAPTAVFTPMVVSATDCSYGGEFKSIEAVDQYTVKFSLCYADPAFPSKVAFSVFAIQDKDYLDANSGDSVKMSAAPN